MVNCKGVVNSPKSPVNQEICRYCRTRVCEECYVAATSRNSMLQSELVTPARHRHVCLACTRLHSTAKERSPAHPRRQSQLPRLNSAPISGGPRIDSLSNMVRDRSDSSKPRVAEQTKPEDLELSTVDLRRRRHTSAIAPTSREFDFSRPARGLTARQLLRANATELQSTRRHVDATELQPSGRHERAAPTSYSCDFTSTTPRMAIRDATSTEPKELTMMDLRDVPMSKSCDLTGARPMLDMSDESNELELSTVDLRLPKYKVNVPVPTKRGRRASAADPANSALTPISIEHLAAIDAKLSSVELELKRYDNPTQDTAKPSSVSSGGSGSSTHHADPIDFHLSTVDLRPRPRPRRHTTTDALAQRSNSSRHRNQEVVAAEEDVHEHGGLARFQRKKDAEPIDFHLSTFDLKPRRHTTDAKPESNQADVDRHQPRSKKKEKRSKATPGMLEQTTPKYSKNEPCDLGYLTNFRSYTV